ncbi:FkbM family methyltransferase [Methylobacterium sp. A54F]
MTDAFLTRRVPLGGRMRVIHAPAGDWMFTRYTSGGRGVRHFRQLCRAVLDPDSVTLDVGANIGLTALLAADVAVRGRIYAVEAAPRNFAALRQNVFEHGASIIRPIHCAVGAEDGSVSFFDNSTFGYVVTGADLAGSAGVPVPLRRIDGLVAERGLTRLDFIKMDIEGFEQEALAGAGETLDRFAPLVMLEFNSWCQIASFDRSPRRFLEWLLDTFSELHVWRHGALRSVREMGVQAFLHANLIEHGCNTDLLAARSGERIERLRAATQGPRGLLGWRRRLGL